MFLFWIIFLQNSIKNSFFLITYIRWNKILSNEPAISFFWFVLAGAHLSSSYILNLCMFSQPFKHFSSFKYFLNLQESSKDHINQSVKLVWHKAHFFIFWKCNLSYNCLATVYNLVNENGMHYEMLSLHGTFENGSRYLCIYMKRRSSQYNKKQ